MPKIILTTLQRKIRRRLFWGWVLVSIGGFFFLTLVGALLFPASELNRDDIIAMVEISLFFVLIILWGLFLIKKAKDIKRISQVSSSSSQSEDDFVAQCDNNSLATAKEGASKEGKKLQGVLVMTRRPLNNTQVLLQQIVDEQKSKGHPIASGFIATTRIGDANDQAYVYATIRTAFESFGGKDVIERITVKTFQASDGNGGSYFILFDRP